MHEMPFVLGLLAETQEAARAEGLARITRIRVEVGALSGIEPDCVRLYFETASEGHIAEGAALTFVTDPALLVCGRCGVEFAHDLRAARREGRDPFSCPHCGGAGILKKGTGAGARLLSIEGETAQ